MLCPHASPVFSLPARQQNWPHICSPPSRKYFLLLASGISHPLVVAPASPLLLSLLEWFLPFLLPPSVHILRPSADLSLNAVSVSATWEFKHQCYVVGSQISLSSPGLFKLRDMCPDTRALTTTSTRNTLSPNSWLTLGWSSLTPGEGSFILPGVPSGICGLILHSSPSLTLKLICQ